jgi:hypothetical protein
VNIWAKSVAAVAVTVVVTVVTVAIVVIVVVTVAMVVVVVVPLHLHDLAATDRIVLAVAHGLAEYHRLTAFSYAFPKKLLISFLLTIL